MERRRFVKKQGDWPAKKHGAGGTASDNPGPMRRFQRERREKAKEEKELEGSAGGDGDRVRGEEEKKRAKELPLEVNFSLMERMVI